MSNCPHCQKNGIAFFKKILIGPNTIIKCTECQEKVTISGLTNLAAIPFLLGLVGSFFTHDLLVKAILMLSGLIFSALLKGFAVPLVKIPKSQG